MILGFFILPLLLQTFRFHRQKVPIKIDSLNQKHEILLLLKNFVVLFYSKLKPI